MVKNVLIGKKLRSHCRRCPTRARFVGLEFILHELRGVMVNRRFPKSAHDPDRYGRSTRS
jgi:hypothetical protein